MLPPFKRKKITYRTLVKIEKLTRSLHIPEPPKGPKGDTKKGDNLDDHPQQNQKLLTRRAGPENAKR